MRKVSAFLAAPGLALAGALLFTVTATAQSSVKAGPIVYPLIHQDVSLPLWFTARPPNFAEEERFIPQNQGPPMVKAPVVRDPVGDDPIAVGRPEVGTTDLLNFAGQSADGLAPPDTEGVVGLTQYVQYVNTEWTVYDKNTGAVVLGPLAGNSFWSGFGGQCQNNDDGDPIVQWDKAAQRWFIAQNVFTTPYTVCIAVSTSSDATGSWYRYAYNVGSSNFPDYPKWGVWPDAYYQSYNDFFDGFDETGATACAADRNDMLVGNPAPNFICFNESNVFNLLPSDLDGNTPPPAGSPNYYVTLASVTGNLNLYQFHVDFVTPSNSTFTGPALITTAPFNEVCSQGTNRNCIKEPSPGEGLDSLGSRLMYRFAYRNFGTYESLLVAHTVKPTSGTAVGATRWYEIRSPGSSPTVFQQGTLQNSAASLWMASIAQDKLGDIAMGMSVTGTKLDPSVAYTGRVPTDPLGTLESLKIVVKGTGVQESTDNRWGDYADMTVDPTDDCTFWFTEEYIKKTGSFNWTTRINSFKFPGCS